MPLDLKIVQLGTSGNLEGGTWPNPDFVSGEYNLIQRIVKNLLTTPGEDMFDPDWGSGLRKRIQGIAGQEISKASAAVTGALKKCVEDIQHSIVSDDPAEILQDLRLETLEYDLTRAAWVSTVSVITNANQTLFSLAV